MSLETQVAALTSATTNLLDAVNVKKSALDQRVDAAAAEANKSTTQALNAAASAAAANTSAGQSAGSASQALAIFGSTSAQQAAVTAAQNSASVAAGHAASASSVVQQDLSGVNAAALHRSPNAVTAMSIYDTSKDSDGGAWTEKCQHTSWYNEPISGKWLTTADIRGIQSELEARTIGATLGAELLPNGSFASTALTGWSFTNCTGAVVDGRLVVTATGAGSVNARYVTTGLAVGELSEAVFDVVTRPAAAVSSWIRGAAGGTVLVQEKRRAVASSTSAGEVIGFTWTASAAGEVLTLDNISVKPVTTINTTSGDYFQRATDGLFYRLNDGAYTPGGALPGITQTLRGNKRDFPRLAAIVAEAASVTIYDLTEPGRPMWMRFPFTGNSALRGLGASSVGASSGALAVGSTDTTSGSLATVSFPGDRLEFRTHVGFYAVAQTVAQRTTIATFTPPVASGAIVNRVVHAVAMTVLPNAPIDPVTGLKVPTIAVHTAGGVSIIRHDGTVTSHAFTGTVNDSLAFVQPGLLAYSNNSFWAYHIANVITISGSTFTSSSVPFNSSTAGIGSRSINGIRRGAFASRAPAPTTTVNLVKTGDTVTPGGLLRADVANAFNTGYLFGDIRRAYLADVGAGSVGPAPELVTNGTFDVDLTGWIQNSGPTASVSAGVLQAVATAGAWVVTQQLDTVSGKSYQLSGLLGGPMVAYAINGTSVAGTQMLSVTGPTQFSRTFTALGPKTLIGLYSGAAGGQALSADNISVKEVVADRSYKAQGANIAGTLTKTPVAEGAQLVAWSNWSAVNNVQEPFHADLDFGTGEWTCSAWVNVPAVLTANNFPYTSSELITNGDFSAGSNAWSLASIGTGTAVIADGSATIAGSDLSNRGRIEQAFSTVAGRVYEATWVSSNITGSDPSVAAFPAAGGAAAALSAVFSASAKLRFTAIGTQTWLSFVTNSVAGSATFDNVSVREIGAAIAADRGAATGSAIKLGVDAAGRLTATAFDGTTTRTVTTTQAYNTGTWLKARANYRAGRLSIQVNGQEVAATNGAPLATLNNSNAVLTIGNSFALDAPFPGSIALLKFSGGVPTADQALFMFEQEKQMFRAGAQVCLPDANSLVDLTYDDATDKWIAISATNESEFSGLVRTSVTPAPAGSYIKATATSGVQLLARSTTTPGVDLTMPAYGLRSELVKRAEAAAKMKQDTLVFDFDTIGFTAAMTTGSNQITASSITGTPFVGMVVTGTGIPANTTIAGINGTTYTLSANATATGSNAVGQAGFDLPTGYTARVVYSAGAQRREGSTRDYTRLFDGFREQIRFAVTPGGATWVQIHAVKEIA